MKPILIYFLLLTSLFITPALAQDNAPALPQADFSALKRTDTAEVINVIDPQTLQLHDGRFVRLSGLDFPDLNVHEAGDFSLTAMKILQDMLVNQGVNLYQTKKDDTGRLNRMGQHIAHIERTADGAWVQGTLIGLGLARVRTTQRTPEMAEAMYALEKQARNSGAGIWGDERYKVITPEEAGNHLDSMQIVEGHIEATALNNNRLFLNFGKDWRSDFTVSIAPSDKRLFSKIGLDPLSWGGKRVRVRGWVREYNGPYIEINHPQAIELLDGP